MKERQVEIMKALRQGATLYCDELRALQAAMYRLQELASAIPAALKAADAAVSSIEGDIGDLMAVAADAVEDRAGAITRVRRKIAVRKRSLLKKPAKK